MLLFVKKLKKRKDGSTDQEESLQVYKQAEKKWIKDIQNGIVNSDKYQQMKSTLAYQISWVCFCIENREIGNPPVP